MTATTRTYLTTGIAALGAGAIALTPIQPLPGHMALAPHRAESLAVELAAAIDPITPWVDTLQTAAANFQNLVSFYLQQPVPLLTTIGANVGTYISELPDIQLIGTQILGNLQTFFKAPWSPGDPVGQYISPVPVTTVPVVGLPLSQQSVFELLPAVLGQETYDKLAPIINWTATPYSAQITGLLGTLLAPVVQLTRSFSAISADFQAGDVTAAINELINIPANVTNATLNGAGFLDLTAVVNAIQPLPPEVTSIGLNLGGLLNAVPASGTPEAPESWSGGTAFDGLAATISYKISNLPPPNGTSVTISDPGLPVGWWGSVIGLGQFLGDQLLVTPPATAQARLAAAEAPAVADDPAAAVADAAAPAGGADSAAPAAVAKAPASSRALSKIPAVAKVQAAVAKARAALAKAPVTKRGQAASSTRVSGRGLAKAAAARHAG